VRVLLAVLIVVAVTALTVWLWTGFFDGGRRD
jgi:hypothetical protein